MWRIIMNNLGIGRQSGINVSGEVRKLAYDVFGAPKILSGVITISSTTWGYLYPPT